MSVGEVSSEISHDGRLYTRAQQKTPKYFPSNGHSRAHFALHSSRFQGTSMVGPRLGGVQHSVSTVHFHLRPCGSDCARVKGRKAQTCAERGALPRSFASSTPDTQVRLIENRRFLCTQGLRRKCFGVLSASKGTKERRLVGEAWRFDALSS